MMRAGAEHDRVAAQEASRFGGSWLIPAAIGLVALLLRVREMLRTPSWLDEIYVVWLARLSPGRIVRLLAENDMHPPFHFLLVWLWRALGGEGDLWLKSLSIVFGLATVWATYRLGCDLFDRTTGFLAAAFVALHPSALYFSQEIRSYGLLWLLVVLTTWQAWRLVEERPAGRGVWFVLFAVIGLYTHYLFGLILIFLEAWAFFRLWRRPARLGRWVALQGVVVAAFLPQLPTLLHQMARNREHWIRPATWGQLVELAGIVSFGALKVAPLFLGLAFWSLRRSRDRAAATLLLAIGLLPVLVSWYLTRHGAHLYTPRYMVYATPAVCILAAAGTLRIPWTRFRPWLAAALIAVALRGVVIAPVFAESASLGRIAAWLSPQLKPDDDVFCADSHSLLFLRHHLPGRAQYRLLVTGEYLPYFEMSAVIPMAWRVTPDSLSAVAVRGARWWGIRTRHGGFQNAPAMRLFAAAADSGLVTDGNVAVWRGKALSRAAR